MKRLASIAGLLLGMACLVLFARTAVQHRDAFRNLSLDWRTVFYLLSALAAYITTYLLSAMSWKVALRLVAGKLSYWHGLQVITLSQIGKYIPGNIGQYLGRVVLAQRFGVQPGISVASMLLETLLMIIAAAVSALSAAELLIEAAAIHGVLIRRNLTLLAVMVPIGISLVCLVPWSRDLLADLIKKSSTLLSWATMGLSLRILAIQLLNFGLGAFALWMTVRAISASGHALVPSLLGIYAIAWLVGFIVPGAPAGLGIREALLMLGLSSLYGIQVAATATALFRAVTVAGDGLIFALGLGMQRANRFSG